MSFTKQNIRAIQYMYQYLEKLHISFSSLRKIFLDFQDELYEIMNTLNFRPITEQFIDLYNRMITIFLVLRFK